MPELRARQKRLAREVILEAMAEHVADKGLFEFSVPEIARLAGVSHRTVYNYFPNREALLDAFTEWASERMEDVAGRPSLAALRDLPEAARRYFVSFGDMQGIATAFARVDATAPGSAVPADYRRRRALLRELAAHALPDATAAEVDAVAGLVSVLVASRSWYRLVTDHRLDSRQAGAAVAWLTGLLVEAVHGGHLPAIPRDDPGRGSA